MSSAAKVNLSNSLGLLRPYRIQFEDQLKTANDPEGTHQQAIACATVVYHCGRMEAVRFIALRTTVHDLIIRIIGLERGKSYCGRVYVTKNYRSIFHGPHCAKSN